MERGNEGGLKPRESSGVADVIASCSGCVVRNPDGKVFIDRTPSPLGALPGSRRGRQTHVHGRRNR